MKLQREQTPGQYQFTAYGDGYVDVSGNRHTRNLIVLADRLIDNWTASGSESLTRDDFAVLAAIETDIILLATGDRIRFPDPGLIVPIIEARKGLEVMNIAAACRTFNVLVSEGRRVSAALIFD